MDHKNLKQAIEKSGLKQASIARALEVNVNTVWRWAKGLADPDDNTKKKLAQMLNVSVAYLMGEDDLTPLSPSDDGDREGESETVSLQVLSVPAGTVLKHSDEFLTMLRDVVSRYEDGEEVFKVEVRREIKVDQIKSVRK